jgi:putative ABC transport system substrate-binding protein
MPPVVAALAAKAATQTIPIVFVTGADPAAAGLVSSINRPGGNITGISLFYGMLGIKNLELVRALMPSSDVIGFFSNPDNPSAYDVGELEAGAQSLGQQLVVLPVRSDTDVEIAFTTVADRQIRAILVAADPFFFFAPRATDRPRD